MMLVLAIKDPEREGYAHVFNSDLQGEVLRNVDAEADEFVVPFGSLDNVIDCLRIVLAELQREAGSST